MDVEEVRSYIALERPTAAATMIERIQAAIAGLREFPERGRRGRVEGTRELAVPGTPFVVAYRVSARHVDILAVLHGARRWPSALDG